MMGGVMMGGVMMGDITLAPGTNVPWTQEAQVLVTDIYSVASPS